MHDPRVMFERQARWQTSRATLSWTEKLRLAATLRDAAIYMRASATRDPNRPSQPKRFNGREHELPEKQ